MINGSPLLREWVDDAEAAPGDLDSLAAEDERAWIEALPKPLVYAGNRRGLILNRGHFARL